MPVQETNPRRILCGKKKREYEETRRKDQEKAAAVAEKANLAAKLKDIQKAIESAKDKIREHRSKIRELEAKAQAEFNAGNEAEAGFCLEDIEFCRSRIEKLTGQIKQLRDDEHEALDIIDALEAIIQQRDYTALRTRFTSEEQAEATLLEALQRVAQVAEICGESPTRSAVVLSPGAKAALDRMKEARAKREEEQAMEAKRVAEKLAKEKREKETREALETAKTDIQRLDAEILDIQKQLEKQKNDGAQLRARARASLAAGDSATFDDLTQQVLISDQRVAAFRDALTELQEHRQVTDEYLLKHRMAELLGDTNRVLSVIQPEALERLTENAREGRRKADAVLKRISSFETTRLDKRDIEAERARVQAQIDAERLAALRLAQQRSIKEGLGTLIQEINRLEEEAATHRREEQRLGKEAEHDVDEYVDEDAVRKKLERAQICAAQLRNVTARLAEMRGLRERATQALTGLANAPGTVKNAEDVIEQLRADRTPPQQRWVLDDSAVETALSSLKKKRKAKEEAEEKRRQEAIQQLRGVLAPLEREISGLTEYIADLRSKAKDTNKQADECYDIEDEFKSKALYYKASRYTRRANRLEKIWKNHQETAHTIQGVIDEFEGIQEQAQLKELLESTNVSGMMAAAQRASAEIKKTRDDLGDESVCEEAEKNLAGRRAEHAHDMGEKLEIPHELFSRKSPRPACQRRKDSQEEYS